MPEYDVPESNLSWLREKVDKLNARAVKLGVAPIVMRIAGDEQRPFIMKRESDGRRYYVPTQVVENDTRSALVLIKFVKVEVIGEAPVLAGWRFIGTIQHVRDNGQSATILRAVPGYEIGEYRDADPEWCDQCKMSRMRNDTFIVQSVGSDIDMNVVRKRVGRQCLKDFIGHPKPEAYAEFAESLGMLDELFRSAGSEFSGVGTFDLLYRMEEVMQVTSAAIAQFGWVSGKMAREAEERDESVTRTSTVVEGYFHDTPAYMGLVFTVATKAIAEKALAWARETVPGLAAAQPSNDYLYNVAQVAKLEAINHKLVGIAVSIIPAYQREMRKNVSFEERAARSKHVGVAGVRTTLSLMVTGTRTITYQRDNTQGTLVSFEDESGNEFTWFTGGAHGFDVGQSYRVKATIKRHDEFRGVKQTVLNRVQKVA